jgi:sRNA-binding carbon storage regulator CsrA
LQNQLKLFLVERPQTIGDDIEIALLDQVKIVVDLPQVKAISGIELQAREQERKTRAEQHDGYDQPVGYRR